MRECVYKTYTLILCMSTYPHIPHTSTWYTTLYTTPSYMSWEWISQHTRHNVSTYLCTYRLSYTTSYMSYHIYRGSYVVPHTLYLVVYTIYTGTIDMYTDTWYHTVYHVVCYYLLRTSILLHTTYVWYLPHVMYMRVLGSTYTWYIRSDMMYHIHPSLRTYVSHVCVVYLIYHVYESVRESIYIYTRWYTCILHNIHLHITSHITLCVVSPTCHVYESGREYIHTYMYIVYIIYIRMMSHDLVMTLSHLHTCHVVSYYVIFSTCRVRPYVVMCTP